MGGQFFDYYSQADQSIWWIESNFGVCPELIGGTDGATDGDLADWTDGTEYRG